MKTFNVRASRLASIDIFRAVTMLAMIFVNDFWTLEDVPAWMEHSAGWDDAMGLSDVVFPAFLFIVGLSIPFAIEGRRRKGETWVPILTHIFERTVALLLMGIFIVNYESIVDEGLVIPQYLWEILMVIGFFLIWNTYPANPEKKRYYLNLKILGYIVLIVLGFIYKGDDPSNPSGIETRWWGILGLIGWSYFLCAPICLFARDNIKLIVGAWLFFILFNLLDFAGVLNFLDGVKNYVWIVGGGAMPAFVMAGITASVIYKSKLERFKGQKFTFLLIALGILAIAYGLGTRPFWGISKIRATPSWVGLCTGISFFLFAGFFWMADLSRKQDWARTINPAGTATLTCYLVPYIWYALISIAGITLPMCLRTGVIGLSKSFLFALLVILVTGLMNKRGVRLKI